MVFLLARMDDTCRQRGSEREIKGVHRKNPSLFQSLLSWNSMKSQQQGPHTTRSHPWRHGARTTRSKQSKLIVCWFGVGKKNRKKNKIIQVKELIKIHIQQGLYLHWKHMIACSYYGSAGVKGYIIAIHGTTEWNKIAFLTSWHIFIVLQR